MGYHACFILIKSDGKREFYYLRQAPNYLNNALLWGSDHVVSLFYDETPINEEEWLAKSGGLDEELLLDCRQKVVIWYGERQTYWNPIYRRVFLKVAQPNWKDWEIRWAYNRFQDIREYAGYPIRQLFLDGYKQESRSHLDPERDGQITEFLRGVLSIIDQTNQCRLIPLDQWVDDYLLSGPAFFERWEEVPQLESLLINTIPIPWYEDADPNVPQGCGGGIHLNLSMRTLDYWQQSHTLGVEQLIFPMWPGWQITMHYDEFEWQERITNGALSFKIKSEKEVFLEVFPVLTGFMPTGEVDDQVFIEETIAQFATQPTQKITILKITGYLILSFLLILFLWALMLIFLF